MTTKNKFAKYALGNAIGAGVLLLMFGPLSIPVSILALVFGIIGLTNYNKNNAIGGQAKAIVSITLGGVFLLFSIVGTFIALLALGF